MNTEHSTQTDATMSAPVESVQDKIELIPYVLHIAHSETQAELGNLALTALNLLERRVRELSPKDSIFGELNHALILVPSLISRVNELEDAIQSTRQRINKVLYGTEVVNIKEKI